MRFLSTCTLAGLALGLAGPAAARDVLPESTVIPPATAVGERDGAPLYRKEVISKIHEVDRIYRSMEGPYTLDRVALLEGAPELLWVVAYRAGALSPDGGEPLSDEFMCHSNLDIETASYKDRFPTGLNLATGRIATLSQGQLDIEFPSGFGMPVMSDQPVIVNSQVLNLNRPDETLQIRQRVEIDFIRDAELPEPLKPLFVTPIGGFKLVSGTDGHLGVKPGAADPEIHGPGCSLGEPVRETLGPAERRDGQGRLFTGHWIVEPGREVNHTRITEMMALPFDTRAHVIASHMHPFAESLELRDLTTGESVYKALASQAEGRIGLQRVAMYSSEEGIPLYKDHEYEIVSVYDNTSGAEQDAMASMYLYLHGKDIYDFMLRRP